ncbi:MAG: hemolysin family protein [Planctomycetota bacterium]|nr:hemolysin family protein [Planctomycetota bacterium]
MLFAVAVLLFLLLLNGIFAMSEMAVMTSRQSRLQQAAARGSRGAATALGLARDPTRFLSTVQVGITLIGILAGAYGERALAASLREWIVLVPGAEPYADTIALVLVVLLITYFSLVLGELVPKRIALAHPEAVASAIARPLLALSRFASAPVRVLTGSTESILRVLRIKPSANDEVSEDDVKALMARAASTGVFTPQEHALFQRTVRMGDLRVDDLMVPYTEIIWIDESSSIDDIRVLIGTSPFSHFPVCKNSLDAITGVVHIKDLISYGLIAGRQFRIADVVHQPLYVPENLPALKLLDQFQKTRIHIAFVVDEYGGTKGLLTIHDVLGALVGDVSRGHEPAAPKAVRRDDGSWLIDGRQGLHELLPTLGILLEPNEKLPDVSTTAGLMLGLLGHIPTEGEHASWHGWRLEVVDMDGSRIDRVLAMRELPPAEINT